MSSRGDAEGRIRESQGKLGDLRESDEQPHHIRGPLEEPYILKRAVRSPTRSTLGEISAGYDNESVCPAIRFVFLRVSASPRLRVKFLFSRLYLESAE
jgi:hypothetical protein